MKILTIILVPSAEIYLIFIDSVSSKAVIHTDQLTYIEGDHVTLSCRTDTPDRIRWTIITSSFKPDEPPQQYTMAIDCQYIDRPKENVPRIKLRKENCDQTSKAGIRWSNLTIEGIRFEDNGTYRCSSGEADTTTIHVYVYQIGSPEISTTRGNTTQRDGVEYLDLSSADTTLHCLTDCGHPAPDVTWYGLLTNGDTEMIDESNYTTTITGEGCRRGLSRTVSYLILVAQSKEKRSSTQNITCESKQDFRRYGGIVVVRNNAVPALYGEHISQTFPRIGLILSISISLMIVTILLSIIMIKRRGRPFLHQMNMNERNSEMFGPESSPWESMITNAKKSPEVIDTNSNGFMENGNKLAKTSEPSAYASALTRA